MRSYTDIEQSKKLAEILPLESADMYYDRGGLPSLIDKYVTHESIKNDKYHHLIPCWGLAALFGVLPNDCGIDKEEGKFVASYITSDECGEYECDAYTKTNPVDACVEMIIKLHKKGLL